MDPLEMNAIFFSFDVIGEASWDPDVQEFEFLNFVANWLTLLQTQ